MPKQLPDAHAIGDMEALRDALLATHSAGERTAAPLTRADAELAIAREHGFASWRQLAVYVTHPAGLADFLQLACLCYFTSDAPANWQRAAAMLEADPQLASRDIWHASCAGNVEAVRGFLAADPALLDQPGGYFDWPPLLYACYSRLDRPGKSTLAVATLLLERGADANAHYMWGGQYRFTALTGTFGEGEMGPQCQPPHPRCRELAQRLLDAGADPNDSQALYNTMFTPGSACLELLLAHGLDKTHRCNWLLQDDGELVDHHEHTLDYQLQWAARNHHVERAKLLVEHGADVKDNAVDGRHLYEWAWLTGHPDLAEYLADHGAPVVQLDAPKRFAGTCMSGDAEAARRLAAADPDLVRRTQDAMPTLLPDAAAGNRLDAVRTMLDVGFDSGRPSRTALHQAAFHGHLAMAQLLLKNGASLSARDDYFAGTPLQWAMAANQPELRAYLATQPIDIFDAVLCEDAARLGALLDAQPALLEAPLGTMHDNETHRDNWQTPLAFAALRDRRAALAWLLERGARVDVQNGDGKPLLELARETASAEVVALLEGARRT